MQPDNFLAVCMPAYNAKGSIARSIESILTQTFTNFTFVITDDCSSDDTVDIVLKYNDPRISLHQNAGNLGAAATRNKMMRYCMQQGYKYMAVMDADDYAYPRRLEKQIDILEQDQTLAVCGSSMKIERNNAVWEGLTTPAGIKAECIFGNPIPTSTAMIRLRFIALHNLNWDTSFVPCADYHLWYVMLFKHQLRARCTGDVDMVYTYSPDGVSRGAGLARQEEKDAEVKRLILRDFGIDASKEEARHFMRIALSRSTSSGDAPDFFKLATELKLKNERELVDQIELERCLDKRVRNYLAKVNELSNELKQGFVQDLTILKKHSFSEKLLRKIKEQALDPYFPAFSYRLLRLYQVVKRRQS